MRKVITLGFAGILSVILSANTFAQTTELKCEAETNKVNPKKDPMDFLHNYVLNPKSQTNIPQAKNSKTVSNPTNMNANSNVAKPAAKKDESITNNVLCWLQDKYSSMINVLPDQISNVSLYKFIDEWYGVKYRMGGTTKKGVDCSAFVQNLYQYVFGVNVLRTAGLQFQSSTMVKSIEDLKEGDLVFFRIGTSRISHVGVYLKNNFFVHSASSKGVSIANLTNAYWKKYFAGGGRLMN